jgi:hypothetical protein
VTKNKQIRRRRPGAGRKPLDPDGSVVPIRFKRAYWQKIQRLAKQHNRSSAEEVRLAVGYWAKLLHKPNWHTATLLAFISLLITRVEARRGHTWIKDPVAGAAVFENVKNLILHFAPASAESVTLPPELASISGELLSIAENLYPRPGIPAINAAAFGDEWEVLGLIVKSLGSGWARNKAVWFGQKEQVS